MPKAKPLSKTQILDAMDKTKSVKAAARYLNCSYQHLKTLDEIVQGRGHWFEFI